jgi:hypothetical protein
MNVTEALNGYRKNRDEMDEFFIYDPNTQLLSLHVEGRFVYEVDLAAMKS